MPFIHEINEILGEQSGFRDVRAYLSRWYGPDSLSFHMVRKIDSQTAQGKFLVGINLCGLNALPPLTDSVSLIDMALASTLKTIPDHARQHYVDEIGLKLVAGHTLAGAIVETFSQGLQKQQVEPTAVYMVGFDSLRFRRPVFPGQVISITAPLQQLNYESITADAYLTVNSVRNVIVRNLCSKIEKPIEDQSTLFAQHWLLEVAAQGIGVFALEEAIDMQGKVPVLMEFGKSTFAKIPVRAGDLLSIYMKLRPVTETALAGEAMIYRRDTVVANLQGIIIALSDENKIGPLPSPQTST